MLISLYLVMITGIGAPSPKCHIESNGSNLLIGFSEALYMANFYDAYNGYMEDGDTIAAEKCIDEYLQSTYANSEVPLAVKFKSGQEVYVEDKVVDDYDLSTFSEEILESLWKVRIPGEIRSWIVFRDIVKCEES